MAVTVHFHTILKKTFKLDRLFLKIEFVKNSIVALVLYQSVALKHLITGQKVNGTLQNSTILRNLRNCTDVPNTLQYLRTSSQHFVCMHYW